ncbi:MAG: [FeFe] hydrogenase H-cluster maturation GTPase HydF [Lentisphaerae bacterium RIFOXYA12_FULL_48_11]|nr:MAG: [FeFe] hydrogenase H-cluster maturation GTPase HydF [Lentisphaerae bacterium RIFOXYA12_FULL_48_11]
MTRATSKTFRTHIALFGRRNVGKSSLLNALVRQNVSIVSDVPGTTTDPVEKPMELLPLGPVLFIDTAGIDDTGTLGEMRVAKTQQVLDRTDLAIVIACGTDWSSFEDQLIEETERRKIPSIVVFNKIDLSSPDAALLEKLGKKQITVVEVSALTGKGISTLREALLAKVPDDVLNRSVLGDLVKPGQCVVLVVPIDKEAPKGRLINPQVQSIRDALDHDAYCLVVKERELRNAMNQLRTPPALVITDSQAFLKVAGDTPSEIPMTSFSMLFARFQGDLSEMVRGALAADNLKPGDRILVAEACAHHPIGEDIGRVKIPRWLTNYIGGKLEFEHVQGHDFPKDLSSFSLVVHCGACMWNRREMLNRIMFCRDAGVPITNYGVVIAYSLGILERALRPFPAALDLFMNLKGKGK